MIEIQPIRSHQIERVKSIILEVCQEIFEVSEIVIQQYDDMSDIDKMRSHYLENQGTFLVLTDNETVVGSGGIRRLDDSICELKRMWILQDYRGRGWGMKMAQMLLDFANKTGCKKVRLDVVREQKQARAIAFYKNLGFYQIERYNDGPCTIFMEKIF